MTVSPGAPVAAAAEPALGARCRAAVALAAGRGRHAVGAERLARRRGGVHDGERLGERRVHVRLACARAALSLGLTPFSPTRRIPKDGEWPRRMAARPLSGGAWAGSGGAGSSTPSCLRGSRSRPPAPAAPGRRSSAGSPRRGRARGRPGRARPSAGGPWRPRRRRRRRRSPRSPPARGCARPGRSITITSAAKHRNECIASRTQRRLYGGARAVWRVPRGAARGAPGRTRSPARRPARRGPTSTRRRRLEWPVSAAAVRWCRRCSDAKRAPAPRGPAARRAAPRPRPSPAAPPACGRGRRSHEVKLTGLTQTLGQL